MTLNLDQRKKSLIEELRNQEYREAFVSDSITVGIPFQIKALREQEGRKWSQKELGKRAGMLQERISQIEDPNYGRLSLSTLKRIASAFDIGLVVRFVPFSDLVKWELNLSPNSLKVPSFNDENYFKDGNISKEKEEDISDQDHHVVSIGNASGKVVSLRRYTADKTTPSVGLANSA